MRRRRFSRGRAARSVAAIATAASTAAASHRPVGSSESVQDGSANFRIRPSTSDQQCRPGGSSEYSPPTSPPPAGRSGWPTQAPPAPASPARIRCVAAVSQTSVATARPAVAASM